MSMVLARVLYLNALREGVLSYSDPITAGFEPVNAADWRDFSLFRVASGTSILDCRVDSDQVLNTAVVWLAPAAGASATSVSVRYESAPGVVTSLGTFPLTAGIHWITFGQVTALAGRIVRFRFEGVTGAFNVRQLTVGARLEFPIGQWSGVAIPTLTHGMIMENVISINGSIIGRNIRRQEKEGQIELNYLDPVWVRTEWEALAQHATRFPFWYQWDPAGHPDEVAFAAAKSVEAPRNDRPAPKMAVSMPLSLITD